MTAAEIHSQMPEVSLALIRGCIQTMVKVGLVTRIGSNKPYSYQVARSLKQPNRGFDLTKVSFAQQVRDALKAGPNRAVNIAEMLGSTSQKVGETLRENRKSGFCKSIGDGMYEFVYDPTPKPLMSKADRAARQADYRKRKAEEAGREYKPNPLKAHKDSPNRQYTVIKPKTIDDRPTPSTEDWIKAGGVVDRSPTRSPFERLTVEDICNSPIKNWWNMQNI